MWWAHALLEIAVLFGIIVMLEMKLGDGKIGAYKVHPHPYWLVVIPMAAARGVVAGMVAACVASALYLMGAQRANPGQPIEALLTVTTMLEPILFFGVGFLVGEFRDVTAARNKRQAVKLAAARNHAKKMREQRDVLSEANRILEKRLVDHTTQFGNLIVAATRIEHAGRKEAFEIALELIEEHCGAGASVLMPLADGTVDFLCHRGWPETESADRLREARACDFVRRAVEEGRTINGFSLEESPPDSGPLVVAPLVDENGVIEALLCLDEIPTSRLNASAVRTFLAIGEWVSAVLARLSRTGEEVPITPTSALLEATPNPHALSAEACLESLDAEPDGLSAQEAARRLDLLKGHLGGGGGVSETMEGQQVRSLLDDRAKFASAPLVHRITDQDFPEISDVDSKLVKLAKVLDGKVLTNDFNLWLD